MSNRCDACTEILETFKLDLQRLTACKNDTERLVGKEMYQRLLHITTNNIAHIKSIMKRHNVKAIERLYDEIRELEK
jgi:hypothetical protein